MRPITLTVLSSVLLSFSGRPWGSPYFALFALIPVLLVLSDETKLWRGAIISYLVALPVYIVGLEGLANISPPAFYITVFTISLCLTLPGILAVWVRRHLTVSVSLWVLSVSWIGVETLSGSIYLWNKWANPLSIGLSQVDSPLAQLAFWSGIHLSAFCVFAFNIGFYYLLQGYWKTIFVVVFTTALCCYAPYIFRSQEEQLFIKVGIVQALVSENALLAASFSFHEQEKLIMRYHALSEALINDHPDIDLLVWPETAIGWYTNYLNQLPRKNPFFPNNVTLLTGSYRLTSDGGLANSILLWRGSSYNFVYDKQLLVPIYENHLRPGNGYIAGLVSIGNLLIGLGVCWESLYSDLSRQSVIMGANILIYVSDGMFAGNSITPWYHMRSASIRAIETNRVTIFASHPGPSGIFDSSGRRVLSTTPDTGYWFATIPIQNSSLTPFVRFGNWFGWLCTAFTTLLPLLIFIYKQKNK